MPVQIKISGTNSESSVSSTYAFRKYVLGYDLSGCLNRNSAELQRSGAGGLGNFDELELAQELEATDEG